MLWVKYFICRKSACDIQEIQVILRIAILHDHLYVRKLSSQWIRHTEWQSVEFWTSNNTQLMIRCIWFVWFIYHKTTFTYIKNNKNWRNCLKHLSRLFRRNFNHSGINVSKIGFKECKKKKYERCVFWAAIKRFI